MAPHFNRRRFLQTTTAAGVGYWVTGGLRAEESKSPNEQIQFACIGVGGKGSGDSGDARKSGKVLGICDIDTRTLDAKSKAFSDAEKFTDYREMIDKLAGSQQVKQVFVRHAFRFWMGRNETINDATVLQDAYRAYEGNGGSMQALIASLVTSDAFLYRTVERGER